MTTKLLYNCQILTMLNENIMEHAAVGITSDRITMVTQNPEEVERFVEQNPSCEKVDCRGQLVMPGLINTHTHSSMTLMRNLYENMELMTWLQDHVWKFEAHLTDDDIEAGARLSMAEMILGGTTTFVDMYFSMARVARAAKDMGMRALLTETLIVGREESFIQSLEELAAQVKDSQIVRAGVAPHAPYTIPPSSAEVALREAAKYSIMINAHLSETSTEEECTQKEYGCSATEYFDRCGFLREGTILAHCVRLDTNSIEIIKKRGCSVAHCPESNMKLASGVAPLIEMHRAGVNCTIATDGVCSNNDLDMWGEMRSAALLQRVANLDPIAISPFEILKMATVNGAKAIGKEGELGVIKEGALADIIVVNTSLPHHRPRHNIISSLIFCGRASDVTMTIIAGKILYADGVLLHCDVEKLCQDVERRSYSILSKMSE